MPDIQVYMCTSLEIYIYIELLAVDVDKKYKWADNRQAMMTVQKNKTNLKIFRRVVTRFHFRHLCHSLVGDFFFLSLQLLFCTYRLIDMFRLMCIVCEVSTGHIQKYSFQSFLRASSHRENLPTRPSVCVQSSIIVAKFTCKQRLCV